MLQLGADSLNERICHWIRENFPQHDAVGSEFILANTATANVTALSYIAEDFDVGDGYRYRTHEVRDCAMISSSAA